MPRLLFALALLTTLLLPLHRAHAADALAIAEDDSLYKCKKYADGARIRVTLKPETTLGDLVAWAMGFSCKSFLYGNGVGAHTQKVTVMAPTDMTPREAYRLFLVSLSSMNLTVVPHGKTLEIVEQNRAKESALPIVAADALPGDGGMVRMIVRPRHIASADLATVLSAIKSPAGSVLDVPAASVVVITDEQPMLARMLEIATLVDVERRARMARIELAYTDADEVTRTIATALGDGKLVKVLADAHANALLVIGPEEELASVAELVRMIDVPARGSGPRAHVVRLEHADAEETAGVLASVFSKSGASAATAVPPRIQPVTSKAGAPVPGASTSVASAQGEVKISFAKSTNVLIVIAADEDFRSVREVVRELDVQRPQVYVEALIMDMSVDRARSLGVSLHGATKSGDLTALGASTFASQSSVITKENATGLLSGLSLAILGPSFDFLGLSVPSLGALFQASRTTSDINVLSSPQLMATDHEEATLKIGSEVPTLGATTTLPTGVEQQSVQRLPVNLEFKIKPHIGSNGDVTLDLDLDIKELGTPDKLGVVVSTRAMHTTVTVKDQEPIVLGGLMSDTTTVGHTSVPLLGDIPLLGVLFRSSTTTHQKRNLVIVLVPYVVMDAVDARVLLERKMRERHEFETAMGNLQNARYQPAVDYRKKRGLVAEINHQVRAVDEDNGLRVAPDPAPTPLPSLTTPPIVVTPDD